MLITPTWDMVKAFPMLDGKSFDDPTGKYYVGNEDVFLQRYWMNRDPHGLKIVFYITQLCIPYLVHRLDTVNIHLLGLLFGRIHMELIRM